MAKMPITREIVSALGVRQSQLLEAVDLTRQIERLAAQVKTLEASYKAQEAVILTALKAGARIEPGTLTAAIAWSERRSVSWKDAFITIAGLDKATRLMESTVPTKTASLVISGKGV